MSWPKNRNSHVQEGKDFAVAWIKVIDFLLSLCELFPHLRGLNVSCKNLTGCSINNNSFLLWYSWNGWHHVKWQLQNWENKVIGAPCQGIPATPLYGPCNPGLQHRELMAWHLHQGLQIEGGLDFCRDHPLKTSLHFVWAACNQSHARIRKSLWCSNDVTCKPSKVCCDHTIKF